MRKALLIIIAAALLCSCSSFFKASAEGVPVWYVYETALPGQRSFTAIGQGANRYEASLNAYGNIVEAIEAFLGKSIDEQLYHQFITSKTISAFLLSIENEEIQVQGDGTVICYVQALGNLQKLTQAKDDSLKEQEKLDQNIGTLLSQADILYRENKDVSAVKTYLQAAIQAYGKTFLEEEHQYKVIMDRAILIIRNMNLTIVQSDPSRLTAKVSLSRKNLLRNSTVQDAYIRASYMAVNAQSQTYEAYTDFYTGSTGVITYLNTNNGIVTEGTVRFSLVLAQEIQTIKALGDEESCQALQEAVDASSVSFSYKRQSPYSGKLSIFIQQYDLNGDPTSQQDLSLAMIQMLKAEGIDATLASLDPGQSNDAIIEQYIMKNPQGTYLIYGRAGFSQALSTQSAGYSVLANFTLDLLDAKAGTCLQSTGSFGTSAFAPTLEASQKKALELYVNTVNPILKSWLF